MVIEFKFAKLDIILKNKPGSDCICKSEMGMGKDLYVSVNIGQILLSIFLFIERLNPY